MQCMHSIISMKIQETVDYQIRGTLFAMRRMYNLLAAEHGVTQGVAYVLIMVPRQGVAATRIAPMMGMSSTSLTRLLKNMEEEQLIYRRKDKVDRRVVFVHLTEKGVQLRKKVRQVVTDFNSKVFPQISEADFESFVKVCSVIREEVCKEVSRFEPTDCTENK